jgi:hypothetical protein
MIGPSNERARILGMLESATQETSGMLLLIRGETGIGKTALLDYAVAAASDMLVLTGRGMEPELDLAYGQLSPLLRPAQRFVATAGKSC